MKYVFFLTILNFLNIFNLLGNITFRSRSSSMQFDEGANLVLDKQIPKCQGNVIRNRGATITGYDIVFNNGTLETEGNRFRITGKLRADDQESIVLDGGKSFRGIAGIAIQNIQVSNSDNKIEGDLTLNNDLVLLS